ncbi:MAG: hypothetical protein IH991_09615 [Planctomycetes bacterium]|nr:hypothetical protein [Planctomycetota bacterium]
MEIPLHFASGLPRSGATLLMNLLGQNPAHRVTPTSGLIELFVTVKDNWTKFVEFKAEGLEKVKLRGMVYGYFANTNTSHFIESHQRIGLCERVCIPSQLRRPVT